MAKRKLKETTSSASSSYLDEEDERSVASPMPPAGKKSKTIEERYTKMSQLQHILARPDTYVGAISPETATMWVWNEEKKAITSQSVTFVPALYKIYDEIIVNAADVKAREIYEKTAVGSRAKKMTRLEICIDRNDGWISVLNDGSCIPIEVHKEHHVYVPELIFGHLLTSDNYDDSEQRVTGGRNGYGAKLTNVFSLKFEVECTDSSRKRSFKMTWFDNMSRHNEPELHPFTLPAGGGSDYVKVTFWPDFKRLNTPDGFHSDIISLFEKRAYDMAGTVPGITVKLNGTKLSQVKSFKDYVDLYFPRATVDGVKAEEKMDDGDETKSNAEAAESKGPLKIYEKVNDMWEVVIAESENGSFQQVSFVNSICTSKGGTHVNHLIDPIVEAVVKKVNTRNRQGFQVKSQHVRNHIFMFVNCRVVNPTFDSQTKEWMSLSARAFNTVHVSDKTVNAIVKSEITENVLLWAQTKEQVELKRLMKTKTGGSTRDRILGIPKLEDANDAGTARGHQCTLILTEGDSAKTSCIAGLSVVGKDRYGVFPLRGKLLNVRDASFATLAENKEIQNLLKITGLQIGKKNDVAPPPRLRYGSIMIMTDQDYDGSHIKGLLINLIQYYWPDLLKENRGFLKQFITPIIKATKKTRAGSAPPKILSFFTLKQYLEWKASIGDTSGWSIKYYKGLGTSGDKEFIEYFKDLQKHTLEFEYENAEDFEAIDMAFNSKRAEDRKKWISSFRDEDGMNYCGEDGGGGRRSVDPSLATHQRDLTLKRVRYVDFVNKELVQFSRYDLERSIPSLVDGLKPAQRKAVYGALEKGLWTKEMKVAQLAAYVSDVSCYHHGEESMAAAIVNMAQNFVGSSNINIFEPRGQFGSRKEGGKDASATRYIYTKLTTVAKCIFKQEDAPILFYKNEEGKSIEPKFYVPVIPMILVNGSEGIGTGWSSSIPNYNPHDIIQNLRVYLNTIAEDRERGAEVLPDSDENYRRHLMSKMKPMKPWYRGFIGTIEENSKGGYDSCGIIDLVDDLDDGSTTYFIAELPVKNWTQPYKEWLEELLQAGLGVPAAATAGAATKAKAKAKGKAKAKAKASATTTRNHKMTITDYRDNSTHENIAFTVTLNREQVAMAEELGGLEKAFKLRKPISTSNMTLFAADGLVRKYANELEILLDFCQVRREYYVKRKHYQTLNLERELCLISNKLKFVLGVIEATIVVANKKKSVLESELKSRGFHTMEYINKTYDTNNPTLIADVAQDGGIEVEPVAPEDAATEETETMNGQYDYLLSMQIYNLTHEKVEAMKRQFQNKEQELEMYRRKSPEQLWLDDLDLLETALVEAKFIENSDRSEAEKARRLAQGLASLAQPVRTAPKRKAKSTKQSATQATLKTKVARPAATKPSVDEDEDDDALFGKLKAATNAATEGMLTKPSGKSMTTTSTSSSNEFSFMETIRDKLNKPDDFGSFQPTSSTAKAYSNPPGITSTKTKKTKPVVEEEDDEDDESPEDVSLADDDEEEDEESLDDEEDDDEEEDDSVDDEDD